MEENYKCEKCGKIIKKFNKKIPKCCGKKMIISPIDNCIQPAHAENSRPMEHEDACDNGRAG